MNKKFAIVLALALIAIVCCAGCIDPQEPVDPVNPVDPVDPVDPVTPPVDPVVPAEGYSVFFMLNYGEAGAYTAETVTAGDAVAKPTNPTRSGYTFKGWFTAAEGGVEYDFTQAVNEDVTLYAQWSKKSSSGGSSTPSHTHSYGDYVSNDDGTHTKSCSSGDSTVTENCKFSGYICTLCNYEDSVYHISNQNELQAFAELVNGGESFSGKTVVLDADIDLGNAAWTPIGSESSKFAGTFDGNGKTISNLNAEGTKGVGFFGYAYPSATIKNLVVKNAVISGSDYIGGIVGSSYGSIIGCSVENVTLTATPANGDGGAKVGGIVGYLGEGSYIVSGNTAKDVKITAFRDAGGIAGMAQYGTTVSGNTVDKLIITIDQATGYYANTNQINAGNVVGRLGTSDSSTVTLSGNTATNVDIKYIVGSSDALKKVLSLDVEKIDVTLADGITLEQGTDTKYGGEGTQTITINGNGKTLTYSDSYRTYVNLKNPSGKLILDSLKISHVTTSTNTHWHDVLMKFFCNVEMNDVTFDKGICIEDVTAKLTDVTITSSLNTYGLWIVTGADVTIMGSEITATGADGRAIKIAHEDADSSQLTKLSVSGTKFTSNSKAAILATVEDGGAEITISNIDITNVAADSTNAVWVDEDRAAYYDKVTVTGGSKILEPNVVTTIDGLQSAVNADSNIISVKLGADITGDLTVTQKPDVKITIDGDGKKFNGVITVDGKSKRYETAALTIKNVNFEAETLTADAFVRLGYINAARYTNGVTVEDCTFTGNGFVAIKSYTAGDWDLVVDGCTVNVGMHSMLQLANVEKGLKVTDCNVYSKNGVNLNNCPSIEMSGCKFDVTGYAVRFGVGDTGSVTNTEVKTFRITNSNLKSACDDGDAVIMFRDSAKYAALDLTDTTLTGTTKISGNTEQTTITPSNY